MIEARKIMDGLSFMYNKIDACLNDCILFWKENENGTEYIACHATRWKEHGETEDGVVKRTKKAIPAKMLRYFPLKPRL